MASIRGIRLVALVGLPIIVLGALTPALAQPATGDTHPKAHEDAKTEKNEWTEKYKDELKDHPRLGKALVDLHIAKTHLEKAPHDFGGHRADAVKACDEAIKQIELAVKFDAKHDDKAPAPTTTSGGTTTTPPKK